VNPPAGIVDVHGQRMPGAPNAAAGFSGTVTVQTGTETVSLANGFTTVGTPVLSSLSPASGQPGQTFTVTIGGGSTNFVKGLWR